MHPLVSILWPLLFLEASCQMHPESIEMMITDDIPPNRLVGKVRTSLHSTFPGNDEDNDNKSCWRFQIVGGQKHPGKLFRINADTGELYTHELIDREEVCSPDYSAISSADDERLHDHIGSDTDDECILYLQVAANPKLDGKLEMKQMEPQFVDLKIIILDRNDHTPTFIGQGFVNLSVPESAEVGSRFPLPLAFDPDTRQYSVSEYIAEPQLPTEWTLISETGEPFQSQKRSNSRITGLYLKLNKPLDYENKNRFSFKIRAVDGGISRDFSSTADQKDILQVYIYVEDINDNGPIFRSPDKTIMDLNGPSLTQQTNNWLVTYTNTVPESKWIKSPILKLIADDIDGPTHSNVQYFFSPSTSKQIIDLFDLNSQSGHLFLRKKLDYELQSKYKFRVIATDTPEDLRIHSQTQFIQTPSSIHTATAEVIIIVTDTNDETPDIEIDVLTNDLPSALPKKYAEVKENSPAPQFIASVLATDRDGGINGKVSCIQEPVISQTLWPNTAYINHTNTDSSNLAFKLSSPFQLSEIKQGNGLVQYMLQTRELLDREDTTTGGAIRQVKIICSDAGHPPLSSTAFVTVKIIDENDNAPTVSLKKLSEYMFATGLYKNSDKWPSVLENSPVGTLVTRLNASDLDEGENRRLTFSLEPVPTPPGQINSLSLFQINEKTGDILTKIVIDREAYEPPLANSLIRVKVSDNGSPPKSVTHEFQIHILDENDNPPVFQQTEYKFQVRENLPAGYAIGEILISDKDDGEIRLTFGLKSYGTLPFMIWKPPFQKDQSGQSVYSTNRFILNTTRQLDREVESHFNFTIIATDGPALFEHGRLKLSTATATVNVIIENENDNDPVIIFPQKQNKTFFLSIRDKKDFELLTINVNDKDPYENPPIFELTKGSSYKTVIVNNTHDFKLPNASETTISERPDFLDIDSTTGVIFLIRDMQPEDKGIHVFKVQVTDAGVPPRSSAINFFVLVDDSSPRSLLTENKSMNDAFKRETMGKKKFNGIIADKDPYSDLSSFKINRKDYIENKKMSKDEKSKQRSYVAGDMVIMLALGLIFFLLIATLGLVVYMRYWRKKNRGSRRGTCSNRNSLLFANQNNGGTCMKEIRVPAQTCFTTSRKPMQDQWLCTSDGSIIGVSSQLIDDYQLKNGFAPSAQPESNVYYKTSYAITSAKTYDTSETYSPLSPSTSILLKSPQHHQDFTNYSSQDINDPHLSIYSQHLHVYPSSSSAIKTTVGKDTTMQQEQIRPIASMGFQSAVDKHVFTNSEALNCSERLEHDCQMEEPMSWDGTIHNQSSDFHSHSLHNIGTSPHSHMAALPSPSDDALESFEKLNKNNLQGHETLYNHRRSESDNQLIDFYPRIPTCEQQVSSSRPIGAGEGAANFLGYKVICTPVETPMYTSLTAGSADEADFMSESGGVKLARFPKDCQLVVPSRQMAESLPVSPASCGQGTLRIIHCESPKRRSALKKNKKSNFKSSERTKANLWTSYV